MLAPGTWHKSSYSGGGQGDACVEVALRQTHIAVRDSKAPTRALLSFQTAAFTTFVQAVKDQSFVGDFVKFQG
jgi:hypothetical protein